MRLLYTLLCVVSHLYTNKAGGLGKLRWWERAGFAGRYLHQISVLKYIYFFKTFYKI
jgi:hypothetical protein